MNNRRKITAFLLAFFFLLAAGFAFYYYYTMKDQPVVLKTYGNPGHKVEPFSFINQDGKTITEKDVRGKVNVVEYFFATCKGICPKMNEHMNEVYKAFKGNSEVLILSHTVDPKNDTPEALKAYSLKFEADPNQWMFLTGDKAELYNMARYSYLISAQDDTTGLSVDKDFIHDNHFVLVDQDGRIRGMYDGLLMGEVNQMIGDIKVLLAEKN